MTARVELLIYWRVILLGDSFIIQERDFTPFLTQPVGIYGMYGMMRIDLSDPFATDMHLDVA